MKKFMGLVLGNRFLRFLFTVVMFIIIIVPVSALEIVSANMDWDWSVPDGALFIPPVLAFAVCIVGQLFGDIMNVEGWFNNGFVTFLKRAVFFFLVLAAIFVGTGFALGGVGIASLLEKGASSLTLGVYIASMYAPAFAFLAYVIGYIVYSKDCYDEEHKKWLPFFFPISYVGAVLVGFAVAFILKKVNVGDDVIAKALPFGVLVPVGVAIIACFVSKTWPFEEDAPSYSYSGSSYSGSSSGGYSGYTSNTTETNTTTNEYRGVKCCKYCQHWKSKWCGHTSVLACELTGEETSTYHSCDYFRN